VTPNCAAAPMVDRKSLNRQCLTGGDCYARNVFESVDLFGGWMRIYVGIYVEIGVGSAISRRAQTLHPVPAAGMS